MKIAKTSEGLTKVLFDELEDLCNGKSTPQMARSKAALVSTVVSVKKLEMEYQHFVDDNKKLGTTNIKMLK